MVVKVYISGISGNKEVKKRQQRVLMILDSKNIKYEIIDITEPGREDDKEFMQNNSKSNGATVSDPNPRTPLPPQMFNDDEYCGDYDQFDLANEVDTLEQFVKVEAPPEVPPQDTAMNGDVKTNDVENKLTENSHDSNGTIENTNEAIETPAENEEIVSKEDAEKEAPTEKETSPTPVEKEVSPVRQKSVEKDEGTDINNDEAEEAAVVSKEIPVDNAPATDETVNENGAASSREQSEEKEQTEQNTDNPSEDLIKSEQLASTE